MLNTVKIYWADVSSVSHSSEQERRENIQCERLISEETCAGQIKVMELITELKNKRN